LRILTISVGLIEDVIAEHPVRREIEVFKSAINKQPVSTLDNPRPVEITTTNIIGDDQAVKRVHGGVNKAVYAYPVEHYPFWEEFTGNKLQHGGVGENLTITGLVETEVYVGDRWLVGEVELEVTELREPCFKFNAKMEHKGAAKEMIQRGYSGWYMRVLKTGIVKAGDTITAIPGPREVSITQQNVILLGKPKFEF